MRGRRGDHSGHGPQRRVRVPSLPGHPLHGDYLYHVDQAEAEKTRLLGASAASPPHHLRVTASGMMASLVRPEWPAKGSDWDAAVEEVAAAQLVSAATTSVNGSL